MKNIILVITCLFLFGCNTYNSYVELGYASEAKIALKDIHQKCMIYMTDNGGEYPTDLQEVEDNSALDLDDLEGKWEFTLGVEADGKEGTITATSGEDMAGGEGETVIFDVKTKNFTGSLEGDEDGGGE